MSILSGFRDKSFLDKITILNDIATNRDAAELEGLLELFNNPLGDTSVDYMVVTALNGVLSTDEKNVVDLLESENTKLKTLCIRLSGEFGFKSAVPVLVRMAQGEKDSDLLFEEMTALSRIGDPEALSVFRANLDNSEDLVRALCIEMVGELGDTDSIPQLKKIIEINNEDGNYEVCDLTTWKAVEALAFIKSDEALSFIVENLHHRNPTVRRVVTDSLVDTGEDSLKFLKKVFSADANVDDMILSANVIGFIGEKSGLDILMDALDKGFIKDPNVKYAVYEALGRIGTMKGVIRLMDGLEEDDELIMIACVSGLDSLINPGVVKKLVELIGSGGSRAGKIIRAIVTAKALNIFEQLYAEEKIGRFVMNAVVASKDSEIHSAFRGKLLEIGGDNSTKDIERLPEETQDVLRKALAADDSKSMLALYRSILTGVGFEPCVAENGQVAYEFVEQGEEFDIIITDMNMPVMDGMELVSKLRNTPGFEDKPIIMVTTESESSQRDLAAKTGVTAFITKPFTPEQLRAKIAELV
jgi:CheY-like chemotaxis protein